MASEPSSDSDDDDLSRRKVQRLVRLFMHQLIDGCGDLQCHAATCYSHRKRTSDRPLRRYTHVSARAVAFYLTRLDDPLVRLCSELQSAFLEGTEPLWLANGEPNESTSKRDPKSFAQHLFDTTAVKNFLDNPPVPACVEQPEPQARDYVDDALDWALSSFCLGPESAYLGAAAIMTCINLLADCILVNFKCHRTCMSDPDLDRRIEDLLDCELMLTVARKLTHILAQLSTTNEIMMETPSPASHNPHSVATISDLVFAQLRVSDHIIPGLQSADKDEIETVVPNQLWFFRSDLAVPIMAVFRVFLHAWDGSSIVEVQSVAGEALRVLKMFRHMFLEWLPYDVVNSRNQVKISLKSLDLMEAATAWFECPAGSVSLLDHPWLFTQEGQTNIFRALCFRRMEKAVEESHLYLRLLLGGLTWHSLDPPQVRQLTSGVLRNASQRSFPVEVSRHDLCNDLFGQLWRRERRELLRPLRVFINNAGEEGLDQGGVAQELFQAALSELTEPAYGMFTVDPTTRMAWFDPKSLEPPRKFEILGVLFALAIHNGFILPVTFPLALYKKLLDIPVDSLDDIEDGWPDLTKGLRQLRDWTDGDVEEVFTRTYVFSFEAYGEVIHVNMKDYRSWARWSLSKAMQHPLTDSLDAPLVTNANRRQYIQDYIQWLTDKSIAVHYEAFARGFHSLLPPQLLSTVTPRALQLLTEGEQTIDMANLEAATTYDGGYTASSPVIRDFWAVVRDYDEEHKRLLLSFVTASERLPVNGVRGVDFVIQRNGEDGERLPTTMTCFARLLLPEYKGRERLRAKMEVALGEARGFGLR